MALTNRDAYKALEEIVGNEYIAEDPVILDTYAFNTGAEVFTHTPYFPRSGAILIPREVKEIQAIIKACNKYKVRIRPITNGWGFYSSYGMDDMAIQLDLRRMDQIIEINEKSMYAVVEPYVVCSQFQGELMKRGCTNNMAGAGANTSAMPMTAHMGIGPTGLWTSVGDRNVLAYEWIMPDGEILKVGSIGSGQGWFCGDGPGPSIRGILRGPQTVMGGLGIVTKAATKIYPWKGPAQPEIEGVSPYYRLKELPKNMNIHYPYFPTWEHFTKAAIAIAESEIAVMVTRMALPMIAEAMSGNSDDAAELIKRLVKETDQKPGFVVILAGINDAEYQYYEKVLRQIVSENDGAFMPYLEEDAVKREYIWACTKLTTPVREALRASGRFLGALGDSTLFENSLKMMVDVEALKNGYQKQGVIRADEGADCIFASEYENGHTGHAEQLIGIHPQGEGLEAVIDFGEKCDDLSISKYHVAPTAIWGDRAHDKFGPHMMNYHVWLRRIKKTFDANCVSEPSLYISVKDEK